MLIRLVLCLSDKTCQKELSRLLSDEDIVLECFDAKRSPWQKIIRGCADVVILSESLIPEPLGASLTMLNELPEAPTSVILCDGGTVNSQADLVAWGADLVLDAKVTSSSLAEAILAVIEARRHYSQRMSPPGMTQNRQPSLNDFVSENNKMYLFMKEVTQVACTSVPLLILGETGVGKEHLARAIHAASPRSGGPFVTINTAAIPEQLLESELFGHTQGAFTGASRSRRGAFEQAHHGTIFLDEIGDLPLQLQAKLLHTLQGYEVRPLGSEESILVDVRVIAATNRDLDEEVRLGNFRKDLFFRLSVIPLTIPPLRERREDIPALIDGFFERRRQRFGYDPIPIAETALSAMLRYDWPGNVRELINVLERAVILCGDNDEITPQELLQVFRGDTPNDSSDALVNHEWDGKTLPEVLEAATQTIEREYLKAMLRRTSGRIGEAAVQAGITPRSLYNKMKRLGLTKGEFKG